MSELTPYLCVAEGRAAIDWYVEVLGAEVVYEPIEMPDGRLGHVELAVGGARWMMAEPFPESVSRRPTATRGSAVSPAPDRRRLDAVAARVVAAGRRSTGSRRTTRRQAGWRCSVTRSVTAGS